MATLNSTIMLLPPDFQRGILMDPIEVKEEGIKDGNMIVKLTVKTAPVHKNADGEWEHGLYASDERK